MNTADNKQPESEITPTAVTPTKPFNKYDRFLSGKWSVKRTPAKETLPRGLKKVAVDPALQSVLSELEASPMLLKELSQRSGVSTTTLYNWRKGKTRYPQHLTLNMVLRTLGKTFKISDL